MLLSFDVTVTEEMLRHSRIRDILYFASFAYGVIVLALVMRTGLSARLRDAAGRVSRRPLLLAAVYVALLIVVTAVLQLPLSYYAGFAVPHEFGLSNQTMPEWLVEEGKGLAVFMLLGSIVGALTLVTMQRVRRWWLAIWIGSIPVMLLLIVIAPILLDPIFNRFEPLKDTVLRNELLTLASRAQIEGSRVYQVDKSKQTTTMNAYVTGIGPSKRIVMWDTLLAKMTRNEVLAVMSHEMGHYSLHHLWKGWASAILIGLVILFVTQKFYERWDPAGRGDPASFPRFLIIVMVMIFLLSPIMAGISRHMEHQADIFGLNLTGLNEPMATAFIKLAEDTKINPDPHPFMEFWRYSHPSIRKRIEFVLRYKRNVAPASAGESSGEPAG